MISKTRNPGNKLSRNIVAQMEGLCIPEQLDFAQRASIATTLSFPPSHRFHHHYHQLPKHSRSTSALERLGSLMDRCDVLVDSHCSKLVDRTHVGVELADQHGAVMDL